MTDNPYQPPTKSDVDSSHYDRGWIAGFKYGCQVSKLIMFLAVLGAIVSWFSLMIRLKFGS